jgi:hypothetical protein
MIVAITGGRDYEIQDVDILWSATELGLLDVPKDQIEFIHGDSKGVDRYMGRILTANGFKVTPIPADWKAFGICAGPLRNRMLAQKCDLCLAFPGGKGTQNMVNTCRGLGKEVRESPTRLG